MSTDPSAGAEDAARDASRAWLDQADHGIRLEWGPRGAWEAARRGDVVVVVDVLSFSTAVVAALEHKATIVPIPPGQPDAAARAAARWKALSAPPPDGAGRVRRALSPLAYQEGVDGRTILLASPNGAMCSQIAVGAPAVLLGSLRNAHAVAAASRGIADRMGRALTIVPCGERWPADTGAPRQELRPAFEDLLGAGAVAAALGGDLSPEARMGAEVFRALRGDLEATLLACVSGRELVAGGYPDDVSYASGLDVSRVVPHLVAGRFAPVP